MKHTETWYKGFCPSEDYNDFFGYTPLLNRTRIEKEEHRRFQVINLNTTRIRDLGLQVERPYFADIIGEIHNINEVDIKDIETGVNLDYDVLELHHYKNSGFVLLVSKIDGKVVFAFTTTATKEELEGKTSHFSHHYTLEGGGMHFDQFADKMLSIDEFNAMFKDAVRPTSLRDLCVINIDSGPYLVRYAGLSNEFQAMLDQIDVERDKLQKQFIHDLAEEYLHSDLMKFAEGAYEVSLPGMFTDSIIERYKKMAKIFNAILEHATDGK